MRRCIATIAFVVALPLSLMAGSFVWTGEALDDEWDTDANWRGGSVPPIDGTAAVTLGPTNGATQGISHLSIGPDQDILTLTFTGTFQPYELSGGGDGTTLTIRGGLQYAPGGPAQSISDSDLQIALPQSQTWNVAAGSLTVYGNLSTNSEVTLTKRGAGELRLAGYGYMNSFDGTVLLKEGGLSLSTNYALGSGTLIIDGTDSTPWLGAGDYGSVMLFNAVELKGGTFQTRLHEALSLVGTVTLSADTTIAPQNHTPLYLSGTVTESGGARVLTVDGPGLVVLDGTGTYTGGTVVAHGALIFGNVNDIPPEGELRPTGDGYIGLGTPTADLVETYLPRFDKAGTTGIIGFDTDPTYDSANEFSGDVDLTGFAADVRLASTTRAILSGSLTPQGDTYRFGGGGGWIEVQSRLEDAGASEPRSLSVVSSADAPLTVRLNPRPQDTTDVYSGGTTVTQSALIFGPDGLPPAVYVANTLQPDLHLGPGGYIGLEDIGDLSTLNDFLARFPADTAQGIIGFDASGGSVTIYNASAVDLTGFTDPTFYLGTATAAAIMDTIQLPPATDAYRFAAYKGGELTVAGPLSNSEFTTRRVIIGDPDVPATFNDPTGANSGSLSTVKLMGNSGYTAGTTLYAGRLLVSQTNSADQPTTALGSGPLTVEPVNFTHDASLRPVLELGALTLSNPIVLNADLGLEAWADTNYTLTGSISGTGALFATTNPGTITLAGDNSFTGGITIGSGSVYGGKVIFASDTAAGGGVLTIESGTAEFTSAHPVIHGLAGNDYGDPVHLDSGVDELTIDQDVDTTYSGTIDANESAIVKTGTGRLTLRNANDYSGGTTVSGGTLVAGDNDALGSWRVTVDGGRLEAEHGTAISNRLNLVAGSIGGTGTFDLPNRLVIGANQMIAPGSRELSIPGTLTIGANGITFYSNGTYRWQLQSVAGGEGIGSDLLSVYDSGASLDSDEGVIAAGELVIDTSSGPFVVQPFSLGADGAHGSVTDFDPSRFYSWIIASASGGIVGFDTANLFVDTSQFLNVLDGGTFSLGLDGNGTKLRLDFTPVPEPSTWVLLGLGLAGLLLRARRRWSG